MLAWIANPKNLLIAVLAVLVVALGVTFAGTYFVQRGLIAAKDGRIAKQEQELAALTRANEILNNNAKAAKEAETRMQEIVKRATNLRDMVESIPDEVKKGMKNETMERVNHCIGAYFRDGVLPKECEQAGGTVLPAAAGAGLERGG